MLGLKLIHVSKKGHRNSYIRADITQTTTDPFINMVNSNPSMDNNHIPSKVWDEITYVSKNLNGGTVEAWEWIITFITHS